MTSSSNLSSQALGSHIPKEYLNHPQIQRLGRLFKYEIAIKT